MKKLIAITTMFFIVIIIIWTGLYKVLESKEGFYYIDSNFAMVNKALLINESEYDKTRYLRRTVQLCRENAIRQVYLEITDKININNIENATETINMYGIKVGYWYNLQSAWVPTASEVIDMLSIVHHKRNTQVAEVYFVLQPTNEDFILSKDLYFNMIIELSESLYESKGELPFTMNVGWILPAINETELLKTTHNNYSKKLTFHILDIVDKIALIPKPKLSFKSQILNEFMYASKLEKHVNIAINDTISKELTGMSKDILHMLQAEYREIIRIDPKVQVIFLDQGFLLEAMQTRYDLNNDGKVDVRDFLIFMEAYMLGNATEDHDFNHNQVVDMYDLIAIFTNLNGR